MRVLRTLLALLLLFPIAYEKTSYGQQRFRPGRFLLVWAGDADRKHEDFLAVIDAWSGSPTFGRVLKTVPVGSNGNEPHHIDFDLRTDGTLWASGVLTGRIFIFNVSRLPEAKLLKVIEPTPEQVHAPPHTFGVLPNGNTIVTAMEMLPHHRINESQHSSGGDPAPGGLLEFDKRGNFLIGTSGGKPPFPTCPEPTFRLLPNSKAKNMNQNPIGYLIRQANRNDIRRLASSAVVRWTFELKIGLVQLN